VKLTLTIIDENGDAQEVDLTPGSYIIGNDEDQCNVAIPDPHVSPQHCKVEFLEDHWIVCDLQSESGTMVNGNGISAGTGQKLVAYDQIQIGDTYIETEWERVAPTETMCGLLSVLSTPLEPGDYVIEVNGNEQWTVRLEGAGIGPVPTGEEGGSSAADSGCAASATGPHSRSLPILSWLLIAAGLCLLGRRRSRALS